MPPYSFSSNTNDFEFVNEKEFVSVKRDNQISCLNQCPGKCRSCSGTITMGLGIDQQEGTEYKIACGCSCHDFSSSRSRSNRSRSSNNNYQESTSQQMPNNMLSNVNEVQSSEKIIKANVKGKLKVRKKIPERPAKHKAKVKAYVQHLLEKEKDKVREAAIT